MHWHRPNLTWPSGPLYELAPFSAFIELYPFLWLIINIRGSHVRIKVESLRRRKKAAGPNVVSAGFHFQLPFPPRTRTCVNLLPDVIKGMKPVESRTSVLSTRWYSPPLLFYITSKTPSYFYTDTQTTQSYGADSLFNTFLPQSDQNLSSLQGFVWNLTNCSFLIPQRALCPWAFTLWV